MANNSKEKTKTVLTWLVASAWSGNLLASMFIKSYEPNDSINAIFMVIVTAIFVAGTPLRRNKDEKDEEADQESRK